MRVDVRGDARVALLEVFSDKVLSMLFHPDFSTFFCSRKGTPQIPNLFFQNIEETGPM
jgi:hypothetical protein